MEKVESILATARTAVAEAREVLLLDPSDPVLRQAYASAVAQNAAVVEAVTKELNRPARISGEDEDEWGSREARTVAPSSLTNAKSKELQGQDDQGNLIDGASPVFLNYRPSYAKPQIPLTLAHPAFGKFLDVFHGNSSQQPTREDYGFFAQLAETSSRFYNEEADYKDHIAECWKGYTGLDFINELGTGARTHCDLGCHHLHLRALFAVLEAKLGMFGSKSDPGFQAAQYSRLYWLRKGDKDRFYNTCYPVLLVEHVGPFIRVSACAKLEKLCVMPLTPFINLLSLQGHDVVAAEQGGRLCLATKLALTELSTFYKEFRTGPMRHFFFSKNIPYPFHELPSPPKQMQDKLVYLARIQEQLVVVKFVQRPYGESVHRAWAAKGLAPQLYEVKPIAGGWFQVNMEYLGEGWKSLQAHPDPELVRPLALEALREAHSIPVGGSVGVHGDMRDINVMVSSAGCVKFIDFDWAREQGGPGSCYPSFMNHLHVAWADGAEDGQPMLQKHDQILLAKKQKDQARHPFTSSW